MLWLKPTRHPLREGFVLRIHVSTIFWICVGTIFWIVWLPWWLLWCGIRSETIYTVVWRRCPWSLFSSCQKHKDVTYMDEFDMIINMHVCLAVFKCCLELECPTYWRAVPLDGCRLDVGRDKQIMKSIWATTNPQHVFMLLLRQVVGWSFLNHL